MTYSEIDLNLSPIKKNFLIAIEPAADVAHNEQFLALIGRQIGLNLLWGVLGM